MSRHYKLAQYKPSAVVNNVEVPVSVIISARNEAKNLRAYLPEILEQDYPDYEVVVINDCSVDGSDLVLRELQQKYPHLKVTTVTEHPRFKTGKKFAVTMGIKAAKNEHLIFTDADCSPASEKWIKCIMQKFTAGTEIVLGYSPYYKAGGFMNTFIRFETLKTGINYLSAALSGDPYMGIGRNLAYTKSLFFKAKGFASHMHVLSGDDDLFVNQTATANNTAIEIRLEAFTYSGAKTTLASWYRQKRRHMGVGKLYKNSHRRMLSLDALTGFLFYVLLIVCIVVKFEPLLALGLFVFRLVLQLVVYNKVFKKLDSKDLIWYLPMLDVLYYAYLNIFGLIGTFFKAKQWK